MSQVKLKFFVMPNKEPDAHQKKCDFYGCEDQGHYKAPKSRYQLRDYYWFCLAHVRDFNAKWDYFKDMDHRAIEAQIQFDNVWQRPTRPFGSTRSSNSHRPNLPREVEEALTVLGLQFPFELTQLKSHYKQLVKENHPDVHGDDHEKCEKLKEINLAYDIVLSFLVQENFSE